MATARAAGVSKILAFDISQKRVDFAKKLWADYSAVSPKLTEGQSYEDWAADFKESALTAAGVDTWGVDIVVEATGAEACMHAGITFVHSGGTCKFWVLPYMIETYVSPRCTSRVGQGCKLLPHSASSGQRAGRGGKREVYRWMLPGCH